MAGDSTKGGEPRIDGERRIGDEGPIGDEGGPIGDEGLLDILEQALADERAAQDKYRHGLERCADEAACRMFEQLLHEEQAHERALAARYAEVKKRIGLHGAARDPDGLGLGHIPGTDGPK